MLSPDASDETPVSVTEPLDLDDPSNYLNRELTWLAFNGRVLARGRGRA